MIFNCEFPVLQVQNLAVKLTTHAEQKMNKSAHPWIFSNSIEKINKEGNPGDLAILFRQRNNQVYGVGLYDPASPIRIKMLHHYSGIPIDQAFFTEKINCAFDIRKPLLRTKTNSYRLLFGENDGFPGFIADVYAEVLVVKLYSAIWFPYLEMMLSALISATDCQVVVLRLSRQLQQDEAHGFQDGQVLYGDLKNPIIQFIEHGVHFSADVIKGHKTGYFLDHRDNRKKVGNLAKNKTVLDVFSYAGGFSVHALVGGAKEVTSLDVSGQALEMAKNNAKLNQFTGKHWTLEGDAFEILKTLIQEGKTFDLVVIDPPSFAKSKKEAHLAQKKYAQLARLGAQLTAKNGLLVLASCSSRVLAEDFFEINSVQLKNSGRRFKIIEQTTHDIDHPVTFEEGAYLKCAYYQFIER